MMAVAAWRDHRVEGGLDRLLTGDVELKHEHVVALELGECIRPACRRNDTVTPRPRCIHQRSAEP